MRLRRLFGAAFGLVPALATLAVRPAAAVPDPLDVGCFVFLDADLSGTFTPGDAPLEGVRLTNGRSISTTDIDGHVSLTVDRSEYRFATLDIPAGYWPTTPWFFRLPVGAAPPQTADFGLRPCPETASDVPELRWVHVADTQVLDASDRFRLDTDLADIARLAERPAFVVNTGDLVQTAPDTTHWNNYARQLANSPLEVFPVVGNHDVLFGPSPLAHYERWAGPPYYSFDAGNWHFVVYNGDTNRASAATTAQDAWLAADLAAAPRTAHRIMLQHYMLRETDPDKVAAWAAAGIEACFSGHWHSHQFAEWSFGMKDFNISWMRNGALDRTARCFGIVTCTVDGEIRVEQRRLAVHHRAFLVSPTARAVVGREAVEVIVQAYDTVSRVASLAATVTAGGTPHTMTLEREGISRWRGMLDARALPAGDADVTVRGQFEDGTAILLASAFTLADRIRVVRAPRDDWPMFRRCAAGSSYTARRLDPPLELAWSTAVPGMVGLSSPVVANGTVFLGCRAESDVGDAGLLAVDAVSGRRRWFAHIPSGVALAPAVRGRAVIAVSMSDSVYALDTTTGARLWTVPQTDARYTLTAPVAEGDTAWVGTEPQVRAVSFASGAVAWASTRFGDPWYPVIYSAPAVSADRLYYGVFGWAAAETGGFKVFDRATGAFVYGEGGCVRSPLWANGTLYTVGAADLADQRLVARDADGHPRWSAPKSLRGGTGSPALAHGILVVPGAAGGIEAFRAEDGTNLWTKPVGPQLFDMEQGWGAVRATPGTPAISGDVVWIGSLDGNLYAIDLASGAELFRFAVGTPIASSPALSGNMLFVAAEDEHLYGFVSTHGMVRQARRAIDRGAALTLLPPRPNPSGAVTQVVWLMPRAGRVALQVFDVRGRMIRTLADGRFPSGRHSLAWDGVDGAGRPVASGVYWVRVRAADQTAVQRVVRLH